MSNERPKYRSTMAELYAIILLAINNLTSDLARFAAKSSNYTAALILSLKNLRKAAMDLPDEDQRTEIHEVLGNKLPELVEPIKQDFADLKGLIRDAWPNEDPEPRYESAGLSEYNKIGSKNWEHVELLHTKMNAFITNAGNAVKLAAPGGMLAGFPAQVVANYTAFNLVYPSFLASRETGTATAEKVKANNTLYTTCMDGFMKFGVESVFKNDADGQKRYTFEDLKILVSPPGSASLTVKVKKPDDTLVTAGTVTIKKEGQPAITVNINAEGEAVFSNIDPADYAGSVVTPGGVTTNFVKTVNTGVGARITVTIV